MQQSLTPASPHHEAEARAPRMHRRRRLRSALASVRFNEAEARAPRMPADPVKRLGRTHCFNEAEARAPRMRSG